MSKYDHTSTGFELIASHACVALKSTEPLGQLRDKPALASNELSILLTSCTCHEMSFNFQFGPPKDRLSKCDHTSTGFELIASHACVALKSTEPLGQLRDKPALASNELSILLTSCTCHEMSCALSLL